MVWFQSTHSRSVRRNKKRLFSFITISIHALTRSATRGDRTRLSRLFYFNPRTHEECDERVSVTATLQAFQSTHSRGVRRAVSVVIVGTTKISIHALTRSATWNGNCYIFTSNISIHALTRSATLRDLTLQLLSSYFNPRTHEECDDTVPDVGYVLTKFQSTHSRGVRPQQRGNLDRLHLTGQIHWGLYNRT